MDRTLVAFIVVLAAGLAFTGGTVVATDSPELAAGEQPQQLSASDHLDCEYPIEITDAGGETVTVEEEPDEIVAMGASDAQQLWALGVQDRVTGLPIFSATAYLEDREADRRSVTDEFGWPDVEEIVDLDPDLVLAASAIPDDDVQTIRDANIPVYHAPNEQSLEDVYDRIEVTGQLVGACDEAEEVVGEMQDTINTIADAVADEEPVSVYYGMGGGWTAGANTVEDDMIQTAGGENIAHVDNIDFYGEISEEIVVAEDPEWLIMGEGVDIPPEAQDTTAVQEDQIVRVDSNAISQPGPRMVEPVEQMAEAFHPEAIAAIGEETTDETDDVDETDDADVEEPTADDVDDTDTDADDDGAGLTVVAAVVALSALLFVARRRE